MSGYKKIAMFAAISAASILAACSGSNQIASPGEGVFLPAPGSGGNNGGNNGGGNNGGTAGTCPTGFADLGTIAGGTLRNCRIPSLITGTFDIPNVAGVAYSINGRVDVGVDRGGDFNNPVGTEGILNIAAGVTIFGSTGPDHMVVNRGSQIIATGSQNSPVVMTSRQSLEGSNDEDSIGQWGGLVILGRANISNCPSAAYGTAACTSQVEGTNAFYGGNNNNDSSGVLRYFRLMHSGFEISTDNELNGITMAGVGSGTQMEFVQVHNSSDDGIEFFGGTVNGKNIVLTGNDDDSLDTDQGFNGALQFVLMVQRPNGGDRGVEASMGALATGNPRSRPILTNFTFVGHGTRSGESGTLTTNSGTDFRFYNGVVHANSATKPCYSLFNLPNTTSVFRSVYMTCPAGLDADPDTADETTYFVSGSNGNLLDTAVGASTLVGNRINGANESARPAVTIANLDAAPDSIEATKLSFLTQVNYIGAIQNAGDDWYVGWTCSPLIGQPAC